MLGLALVGPFHGLIGDENAHCLQIEAFNRGDLTIDPEMTTLPGYHGAISALRGLLGWQLGACEGAAPWRYRLLSFALSSPAVYVFFHVARRLSPEGHRASMLLRFLFLPILFPMFFVVYTDAFALLCILASLLCALDRRPGLAAVAALLATLVRQTNIAWALVVWLLCWRQAAGPTRRARAAQFLRDTFAFPVLFLLFAAFVAWNGGVALGDQSAHPLSLHVGNVYFALVVSAIVFLPQSLAALPGFVARVRHRPWLALAVVAAYALFLVTYVVDHKYNYPTVESGIDEEGRDSIAHDFLRNRFLIWSVSGLGPKTLAFGLALLGALTFASTRLRRPEFYALYPVAIASLASSWLIEQRYYIVPFVLFIAFAETPRPALARALVAYSVPVSLGLTYGISRGWFFL